jgi:predicted enzyme related to lactoylglutathione lyase
MPEITDHTPGTPCWIDLMTPDPAGDASFYSELFGWEYEVGPNPEETAGYGYFRLGGKMVAGAVPMMGEGSPPVWSTYIATTDINATAECVSAAGGSIFAPPMQVLQFGHMLIFSDPGGAMLGAWQPLEHRGAELIAENGAYVWGDLNTRNVAGAKDFYAAVFGWTAAEGPTPGYSVFSLEGKEIAGIMDMNQMGMPPEVPPYWGVYFAVEDVDAAVAKVKALGGGAFNEPFDTPGGRMCSVHDPVGAMFNVIDAAGMLRD